MNDLNDFIIENGVLEEYNGDDSDVIIPDGVTEIDNLVFEYCNKMTSITIPDSVTRIGWSAFRECSGLTSITIPKNVTRIEGDAFASCSELQSIAVASGNSVYRSAGNCLIEIATGKLKLGCKNSIIPDDGSVKSIDLFAFSGCSGLTSITIPDSVACIDWSAFEGCRGLTSITIPDSVTSIGYYAFFDCSGLTSITVASGNGVYHSAGNCLIETATGELVLGCQNSVIPDDGSVTSIGNNAFSGCSGLKNVTIPSSVTSIGDYAFEGCSGLTSITIPNSVTSIGSYAFYGCNNLVYNEYDNAYYLGNDTNPYVGLIKAKDKSITSCEINPYAKAICDGAFECCNELTNLTVASGNSKYHSTGNCIIETETDELVAGCKNSVIPDDGSVTSIGDFAFCECNGLQSIIIPDNVKRIGLNAFIGCGQLTSVMISKGVIEIGDGAFEGCSSLTDITFADKKTWYRTDNYKNWQNKTDGIETDVTDASVNAMNFTSSKAEFCWYKL